MTNQATVHAASTYALWSVLFGLLGGVLVGIIGVLLEPRARDLLTRWLAIRRRTSSLSAESAHSDIKFAVELEPRGDLGVVLGNLARDPIRGPRIYARQIALTRFRCFERMSIALNHPGEPAGLKLPNVNLVIGENGAGKSTLLKAIAISALGPILDSSGFVPYHLIRSGFPDSLLQGSFILDSPRGSPRTLDGTVEIRRTGDYEKLVAQHDTAAWSEIFDETNPSILVVGYGVNRRVASDEHEQVALHRGRRRRRYERVASLFEESVVLTPLSSWLPDLKLRQRTEVEDLLSELLPAETRLAGSNASEATFRSRGHDVPYRALSDGYKSFIGWVGDLLFQIYQASEGDLPFDQVGGIVLVDEVDLLLHPAWQRVVVPKIARALPDLQFVFTTHSPIVAGTLEPQNIMLASTDDSAASSLTRIEADIHGLNAEQILLSSYFELTSTRAPDAQATLTTLAERAIGGDDQAAADYLRVLADGPEQDKHPEQR